MFTTVTCSTFESFTRSLEIRVGTTDAVRMRLFSGIQVTETLVGMGEGYGIEKLQTFQAQGAS
jgi:hypothetical protein